MVKYFILMCLVLVMQLNCAFAMPSIMTTDQLMPGMQGYAETVMQGKNKVDFNVEIIGVVNNGKGAHKQILARASGDIIDKSNGVIHGMSGSPVYVDGKLIGAVARGVSEDTLPYTFYITPIEDMLKLWDLPDPLANINKSGIKTVGILTPEAYDEKQKSRDADVDKEVDKYKSKELATPEGETREKGKAQKRLEEILNEVTTQTEEDKAKNPDDISDEVNDEETSAIIAQMQGTDTGENDGLLRLYEHISISKFLQDSINKENELKRNKYSSQVNMPVYVTGFSDNALNMLKDRLSYLNMVPQQSGIFMSNDTSDSGSDINPNAKLSPGDPVSVLMAYGDFAVGGSGTVTAVDGNKILAFGHPMTYKGNANYFLAESNIIGSASGLLNGTKVGTFGKLIGRVNQDRFSGVSGILNTYPASVPLRITVNDKNLGIENSYVSKIAYDEDILSTLIPTITYASIDRTADRASYGSANVKFTILTDEMPEGKFERENMFYDAKDVGQFAVGELGQAMYFLATNIDKPSNIMDVKVDITLNSGRNTASLVSAIPDKPEVKPGDKVVFKVTLKPYRKEIVTVDIPYTIPKTQQEGDMTFEVKGGGFIQISQLLQTSLVATPDNVGHLSTADRLNDLKNFNKNNEIVISPTIDIQSDKDQDKAIEAAIKLSEELSKMTKRQREELNKDRESKVATDYVIDNYIQTSVKVKK